MKRSIARMLFAVARQESWRGSSGEYTGTVLSPQPACHVLVDGTDYGGHDEAVEMNR